MNKIKKNLWNIFYTCFDFSSFTTAFADSYTKISKDKIKLLKADKSKTLVGASLSLQLSSSFGDGEVSAGYKKPNGQLIEKTFLKNKNSGNYYLDFKADMTGKYEFLYLNFNGTKYDGKDFYASFEAFNSIEDIFPGEKFPYTNAENLDGISTVKSKDIVNALGQVRFYDRDLKALEVHVLMEGVKNYEMNILNDGLSIISDFEFGEKVLPGTYKVRFEAEGKTLEKEIEVVDNNSESDYVRLSSMPILDNTIVTLSAASPSAIRLSGSDRYETAIAISQEAYSKAKTVIVANGLNFPDALGAVSLSSSLKAPIIFANSDVIDSKAKAEVLRLGAKKAIIVGGRESVSSNYFESLENLGLSVKRISGDNRIETALKVSKELNSIKKINKVILVNYDSFADALSAGALSGSKNFPIIYTDVNNIDGKVTEFLEDSNISEAIIIGGKNSVSNKVESILSDLDISSIRIEGENRYITSNAIANRFFKDSKIVTVASGEKFPDALAGGVLASKLGSPIILSQADNLNSGIIKFISENEVYKAYVFGGYETISDEVVEEIKSNTDLNVKPEKSPKDENNEELPGKTEDNRENKDEAKVIVHNIEKEYLQKIIQSELC